METWELWFPNAAATGLAFARARIDPQPRVWVHAVPRSLRVEVRDDDGRRLAFADQLERSGPYFPMTLLTRSGDTLVREDRWPTDADIGTVVILPGGEAGVLMSWWNAADGSEWRWQIEFYNRRG